MVHFVSAKTLFVLKRYEIANASIMPPRSNDYDRSGRSSLLIPTRQDYTICCIRLPKHQTRVTCNVYIEACKSVYEFA